MKVGLEGKVKVIVEKDGKILKKHEQKMNSFLRNFDHLLALAFAVLRYTSTPAVTLVDRNGVSDELYGLYRYPASDDYPPHIGIGEGTTPVSPDDYDLATPIERDIVITGFTYDSANRTITVKGTWTNNTGATKIIREVGLYVHPTFYSSSNGGIYYRWFMIIRDLLDTPVDVPDGACVTVEFTITVKVSG